MNTELITKTFQNQNVRSFSERTFTQLFAASKSNFGLTQFSTPNKALDFLCNKGVFIKYILFDRFEDKIPMYCLQNQDLYTVISGLRKNSYFTHQSALYIHGLIENTSQILYLNFEHSKRKAQPYILEQESIDVAFSKPQRKSIVEYTFCPPTISSSLKVFYSPEKNARIEFDEFKIKLINGSYTKRLGVIPIQNANQALYVTDIERTIIDITVRPAYAGGVRQVLEVYKKLKGKLDLLKLVAYYNEMNFKYPYHQCIGFYLQQAGYSEFEVLLFDLQKEFYFYITYNIQNKVFDEKWRVWYPKSISK